METADDCNEKEKEEGHKRENEAGEKKGRKTRLKKKDFQRRSTKKEGLITDFKKLS